MLNYEKQTDNAYHIDTKVVSEKDNPDMYAKIVNMRSLVLSNTQYFNYTANPIYIKSPNMKSIRIEPLGVNAGDGLEIKFNKLTHNGKGFDMRVPKSVQSNFSTKPNAEVTTITIDFDNINNGIYIPEFALMISFNPNTHNPYDSEIITQDVKNYLNQQFHEVRNAAVRTYYNCFLTSDMKCSVLYIYDRGGTYQVVPRKGKENILRVEQFGNMKVGKQHSHLPIQYNLDGLKDEDVGYLICGGIIVAKDAVSLEHGMDTYKENIYNTARYRNLLKEQKDRHKDALNHQQEEIQMLKDEIIKLKAQVKDYEGRYLNQVSYVKNQKAIKTENTKTIVAAVSVITAVISLTITLIKVLF